MQDGFFSKAKGSASALKDKIADLKEDMWGDEQKQIVQEFKEGGVQKVKDTIESINNSNLVFAKTGYELKNIAVNLGLPPVITVSFQFNNRISDEERESLKEEVQGKRMISLIVSCLLKAEDFSDAVKVGDYKLSIVVITLGLTPGVTITFAKN